MVDQPREQTAAREPAAELVREALDETRELVRLEVALAREELRGELRQARAAGIALGAAAAIGVVSFAMFMVAIVTAFAVEWLAALVLAGILLCLAGALAFAGRETLPARPLPETKERLRADLEQLEERVA